MKSIHTVLKLAQPKWTGQVIRMPDERHPKENFLWKITGGKAPKAATKTGVNLYSAKSEIFIFNFNKEEFCPFPNSDTTLFRFGLKIKPKRKRTETFNLGYKTYM